MIEVPHWGWGRYMHHCTAHSIEGNLEFLKTFFESIRGIERIF